MSSSINKKMRIPSVFFNPKQPWRQWPSCTHPKTLSFRSHNPDHIFKTLNSLFLHTSDSCSFTNSSSDDCATTTTATATADDYSDTAVESIIRDVRSSERLFFEPGDSSSLLLNKEDQMMSSSSSSKSKRAAEAAEEVSVPFRESVALALESEDPYLDFKKSMQEMVESHGLEEWDRLEELLAWYLKMNAKHNHGFIVRAFVDLLLKDSALDSTSYSSADSCFSAPSSPLFSTPQPQPQLQERDR